MTRINVVPVEQLSPKHLMAEKKEITRVYGYVKKACKKGQHPYQLSIPNKYTLGTGHVKFFYNKLSWIGERYNQLYCEMRKRGYNAHLISEDTLLKGIDMEWYCGYTPTEDDITINQYRLMKRDTESFYKWHKEDIICRISKNNLVGRLGEGVDFSL